MLKTVNLCLLSWFFASLPLRLPLLEAGDTFADFIELAFSQGTEAEQQDIEGLWMPGISFADIEGQGLQRTDSWPESL